MKRQNLYFLIALSFVTSLVLTSCSKIEIGRDDIILIDTETSGFQIEFNNKNYIS